MEIMGGGVFLIPIVPFSLKQAYVGTKAPCPLYLWFKWQMAWGMVSDRKLADLNELFDKYLTRII
jgi:hypothetical protein